MEDKKEIVVTFMIHYTAQPGQIMAISGSLKRFGEWDSKYAVQMTYKETADANWLASVEIPKNTFFEYKYVLVDNQGTAIRWEQRPNRELQVASQDYQTTDEWGIEDYEEETRRNEEMKQKIFEEELEQLERERKKKFEEIKRKMDEAKREMELKKKKKEEEARLAQEKKAEEETRRKKEAGQKEEERKKREAEEEARRKEAEEAEARRKKEEEAEEEKKREEKKKEIDEERLKMEEDRKKKLEELRQKEEERKRLMDEERRKIEEERERLRMERARKREERRKKEEEEQRRREEEQRRKEEEEERKREEEEERKREEEERKKKEEEERKRKEEEERKRKEEEERKKKEEEERRRQEEERRKKEEEERKKKEKKKGLFGFSSKAKEEEEKRKKEEEEKRKLEEKKKQREEEEKKRKEAEAKAKEAEAAIGIDSSWSVSSSSTTVSSPRKADDPLAEIRARKEARRLQEEEEARKEEEERQRRAKEREAKAAERRRKREEAKVETESKLKEIEDKKKEEERKLAELKRQQEEKRQEEERKRKLEEERLEEIKREQLVYTTGDRVMKDVPFPSVNRLAPEKLFDEKGAPYVDWLKDHFLREGRLTPEAAKSLITKAIEVLRPEPTLLELKADVVVIGDTHGQYYDLVKILELGGPASQTQYLFLGDYVDRGLFSTEICFLVFGMKVLYPKNVYLLRGNHECRGITAHYNFKTECLHKYDLEIYDLFMDAFDAMPLAATIESKEVGKFLCTHAGIGPSVKTLDDIMKINRHCEPPEKGSFCDLLWADPVEEVTSEGLSDTELQDWFKINFKPNGSRGCSYVFGYNAIATFLMRNKLCCLVRSHEVQKYGYLEHRFKKEREVPYVVTVFSAPNYCDKYENFGAFLKITDKEYRFQMLTWADHPYYLPHFIDVFTFTLPFIAENMAKFYLHLMDNLLVSTVTFEDPEDQEAFESFKKKMSQKSQALAKTMMVMKSQRMNNEATVQPFASKYERNLSMFEKAVREDSNNELRPLSSADRNQLSRNKSSPAIRQQQQQTRRPAMPQRQATFHVKGKTRPHTAT